MSITINGSGTITGISAGGYPDGSVTTDDLASGAVTAAKLSTGAPSWTSGGDLSFNSGYGSVATAYGCRAWVNFNGTGSTSANQTIRGSGNVSSVYKSGTGVYRINFVSSMPDANYSCVGMSVSTGQSSYDIAQPTFYNDAGLATGYVDVRNESRFGNYDTSTFCASIFR